MMSEALSSSYILGLFAPEESVTPRFLSPSSNTQGVFHAQKMVVDFFFFRDSSVHTESG